MTDLQALAACIDAAECGVMPVEGKSPLANPHHRAIHDLPPIGGGTP